MGFAGSVSVLLSLLIAGAVATDQIFTTSGVPFGRSSREPRYRVEFHPIDSPFYPENDQESVPMVSHEGKHYKCFLPVEGTKTMKSMLQQNATNVVMESERRTKPKEPDELLEILKDQCFYRVIQEFVLGEFDDDATAAYHENSTSELVDNVHHVKDISKRYHVHLYTNGTVCDLTEIPGRQRLFQQEKLTLSIHCNELPAKAESSVEDDSLPKKARISTILGQDELHDFPAYAT